MFFISPFLGILIYEDDHSHMIEVNNGTHTLRPPEGLKSFEDKQWLTTICPKMLYTYI